MPTFPKEILKGERITARWLNTIIAHLLSVITGGNGILVKRHGDKIVIEATQTKPMSGSGLNIRVVTTVFPAIPSTPTIIQTARQKWEAYDGYTKWYPMSRYTNATGTPADPVDGADGEPVA